MSRLLMVGCGWMGRPYLRRAHEAGLDVAVLDSAEALGWPETRAALGPGDRGYAVNGSDDAAWISAASAALRDGPIAGIVAFTEHHVIPAALLADELGLPGPGLRAALTSRNKLVQRELFDRHGLAQPDYTFARTAVAAIEWAQNRYPVVAKPLSSSGSHDVRIVTDETDLRAWCAERAANEPYLIEKCLTGPEYSAETIVDDGAVAFCSITEKTVTPAPYCVELAHHVPADLASSGSGATVGRQIEQLVAGVIGALGMRSGIAHLEFKLEASGPHVIEVAVRTPGDYILDVVEAATGVDLYAAVIAVACGRSPVVDIVRKDIACVWFPTVPEGVVTAVDGAEEVTRLDGVVNIEIDVGAGSTVEALRSSMDRIGMIILRAQDRQELDTRLKTALAELRIIVEPATGS